MAFRKIKEQLQDIRQQVNDLEQRIRENDTTNNVPFNLIVGLGTGVFVQAIYSHTPMANLWPQTNTYEIAGTGMEAGIVAGSAVNLVSVKHRLPLQRCVAKGGAFGVGYVAGRLFMQYIQSGAGA